MERHYLTLAAIYCLFVVTVSISMHQIGARQPSASTGTLSNNSNATTSSPDATTVHTTNSTPTTHNATATVHNLTTTNATKVYTCPTGLVPCSGTVPGNLLLMVFYGAILGVAAKLISDGAELLLDLGLPASLIGGLVLPVLGAVPDAAIIVVSGATGSSTDAQANLQVGMGTLAGSTIMLLTLPWLGSLILGRNDIQPNGEAKDESGYGKFDLFRQGITVLPDVLNSIIIMVVTALPYLIVQSADWNYGATKPIDQKQPAYIGNAAAATMAFALAGLLFYLVFQLYDSRSADRRAEKHRQEMLLRRVAARLYLMAGSTAFQAPTSDANQTDSPDDKSPLVQTDEQPTGGALQKKYYSAWRARGSVAEPEEEPQKAEEEAKEALEGEEEEHESKRMIAVKSIAQLGIGVALVVIFSDPMVSVLTALTDPKNHSYLPVKAFYVSFVVTPICSNASELVSSLIFAMKKRKVNISMSFAQLYGAAIMNNTLCLAVFMALVYFRNLAWEYSAETLVILVVEVVVGIIGYRKTYLLWLGIPIALLYFVSIGMVAFLESGAINWR